MMQSPVGMAYLRQSFKPVEKAAARKISNPQALWSAVSFWRAYNAATKDEQPRGK
jgi:anti-sigma-K factor RskA